MSRSPYPESRYRELGRTTVSTAVVDLLSSTAVLSAGRASRREWVGRGLAGDVEVATVVDASRVVPLVAGDRFVGWRSDGRVPAPQCDYRRVRNDARDGDVIGACRERSRGVTVARVRGDAGDGDLMGPFRQRSRRVTVARMHDDGGTVA